MVAINAVRIAAQSQHRFPPAHNTACGPFLIGGTYWVVAKDNSSTTAPMIAYKTADPSIADNWTAVTGAARSDSFNHCSAVVDGSVIRMVGLNPSTNALYYHAIDTTTDTWTVQDQVIASFSRGTGSTRPNANLIQLSTGRLVVSFSGNQERVAGTDYQRTYYSYSDDDGATWTTPVETCTTGGAFSWEHGTAMLGSADRTHIVLLTSSGSAPSGAGTYMTTLLADGTLGAPNFLSSTYMHTDVGAGDPTTGVCRFPWIGASTDIAELRAVRFTSADDVTAIDGTETIIARNPGNRSGNRIFFAGTKWAASHVEFGVGDVSSSAVRFAEFDGSAWAEVGLVSEEVLHQSGQSGDNWLTLNAFVDSNGTVHLATGLYGDFTYPFYASHAFTTTDLHRWDGTAWQPVPQIYYWDGAAHTPKPLKRWDGTNWQSVT